MVCTYIHTIHTYAQDRLHLLYTVERISEGGQGGMRVSKRVGEWMNDDSLTTGSARELVMCNQPVADQPERAPK